MSREKELLKNTIILGIGYAVPALASFLTLPMYTALLTKTEYGTYDLITLLLSLVMPAITLQIKVSVFRFLIENRNSEEEKKNYITTAYLFTFVISSASIILLFIILPEVNNHTKILICIYVFQEVMIDLLKQTARGLGILNKYVLVIAINSLLTLIFSFIILFNMQNGLNGLLIALNGALAITNIYAFRIFKIKNYLSFDSCSKIHLKRMLLYSAPMVPNSISLWIVRLSDRLVITFFMGLEANAVYSIANKIPNMLSQLTDIFNLSWQENASLAINDKDAEKYYSNITQKIIDLLIGSTAILIASMPILFKLLIKGAYDDAYAQMPILIYGIFFASLSSCYGSIYIALKKTKFIGITSVIGAILNLAINILFIQNIGLFAASLSTVISYCVIYLCRVLQLKKYVNIHLLLKRNIVSFIILLLISMFYYLKNFYGNIIAFLIACMLFILLNRNICQQLVNKLIQTVRKWRNK